MKHKVLSVLFATVFTAGMLAGCGSSDTASQKQEMTLEEESTEGQTAVDDETAAKAMVLAKKMATKLRDGLNCDGFNIVQNNGEIAGQTVFHFHMHLIPRYEGDQVGLTWKPGELTDEMKEEILNKVKA